MTNQLVGIAASDGIAIGKAYLLTEPDLSFDKVSITGTNKSGIVLDINPLFKTAKVKVHKEDGTGEIEEINGSELKVIEEGVVKVKKSEEVDMKALMELED